LIDVEQFCNALDSASPAGADLEYDPDFLALELAQKGRSERQYGDTVIPAEPPDWKEVQEQAQKLSSRTRDLRVACALARAWTHLQGLPGLIAGLQLIDRLCREMWDHVYPTLDETDDNDPTLRMNALAPLADREGLLADLRDSVFLSVRGMGSCTVRQLEIALGLLAHEGEQRTLGLADIEAIANAARNEGRLSENHAQHAIDSARSLQKWLSDLIGAERAPDLQPLVARLKPLADFLKNFTADGHLASEPSDMHGEHGEQSGQGEAVAMQSAPAQRSASAVQPVGEIRSSQDAARMLDLICLYFEKNEPTNPAPLLLRRAQRLATMSFYDIVRDIAPDAISSVDLVAGPRPE
jgi:type VI secretion system protein ImpA